MGQIPEDYLQCPISHLCSSLPITEGISYTSKLFKMKAVKKSRKIMCNLVKFCEISLYLLKLLSNRISNATSKYFAPFQNHLTYLSFRGISFSGKLTSVQSRQPANEFRCCCCCHYMGNGKMSWLQLLPTNRL